MAKNPLMQQAASRFDAGSDAAGQQLFDHCAHLNILKGDRHWFVTGKAPDRRVDCRPRFDETRRTPDDASLPL